MDGAKLITDTIDYSNEYVVSRRSMRVDVFSREDIDLIEMKILAEVRSEQSENLCHRKGKGSLTM